ncbi:MAG: DUF5011 domain-containing protein [Clostridia bacterium]|nr:DUF5011 domain-containing protein [Clostridia bacterium]
MATAKRKTNVKKKVNKEIKKQAKKRPLFVALLFVLLAVGAVGGFFGAQAIVKNDKFEIIGQETITLNIGDEYVEEGAKAVCFGRDVSADVNIEVDPSFDNNKQGVYYIKYTIDNIRFKEIVRYRYVVITEADEEVSE